jgi:hypothetical protein
MSSLTRRLTKGRLQIGVEHQHAAFQAFEHGMQIGICRRLFLAALFELMIFYRKLPLQGVDVRFEPTILVDEFNAVLIESTDNALQRLRRILSSRERS